MPELPEVEVARRNLAPKILGKRIVSFEVVHAPGKKVRTLQNVAEGEFRSAVVGAAPVDMRRKGKFLIVPLSTGETIVFHFMLSGWLDYLPSSDIDGTALRNARLRLGFEDGATLLFTDPRNMGRVFLVEGTDFSRAGVLARIGVEPLSPEFTFERFKQAVERSPGKTVKDFLMDQERIAGIGNIYSDEMMRRAGVRPDRRLHTLSNAEIERLYGTIPAVLNDAIAEIESGGARHMLEWRKKGRTCPDCGGEVVAVRRGASHYYWCPRCQR